MVLEEITNRCSVRKYSDKMPEDEKIKEILEAARLAPSWVNSQPWKFIVIKDTETKQLLSELSHGQPHVAKAPIIIACVGDLSAWKAESYVESIKSRPGMSKEKVDSLLLQSYNPERSTEETVLLRTIEQVTYAVSYMTLEVEHQGLGCCVIGYIGNKITGSNLDLYEKIQQRLQLTEKNIIISLLTVGYPADNFVKPAKKRKCFDDVVFYEKLSD